MRNEMVAQIHNRITSVYNDAETEHLNNKLVKQAY